MKNYYVMGHKPEKNRMKSIITFLLIFLGTTSHYSQNETKLLLERKMTSQFLENFSRSYREKVDSLKMSYEKWYNYESTKPKNEKDKIEFQKLKISKREETKNLFSAYHAKEIEKLDTYITKLENEKPYIGEQTISSFDIKTVEFNDQKAIIQNLIKDFAYVNSFITLVRYLNKEYRFNLYFVVDTDGYIKKIKVQGSSKILNRIAIITMFNLSYGKIPSIREGNKIVPKTYRVPVIF